MKIPDFIPEFPKNELIFKLSIKFFKPHLLPVFIICIQNKKKIKKNCIWSYFYMKTNRLRKVDGFELMSRDKYCKIDVLSMEYITRDAIRP